MDVVEHAHQESFLIHLLGAREALLAELNQYFGNIVLLDAISPGKLRDDLWEQQEVLSPELAKLYELENDEHSTNIGERYALAQTSKS